MGRGEVGLADHQPVGGRRLLQRLPVPVEILGAAAAVDDRDHAAQHKARGDEGVILQRLQKRHRIGKAGGLDDDAPERRDLAGIEPKRKPRQGDDQITEHGAAEAAIGEQNGLVFRRLDQQMIEADLAEFVDDDQRALHVRRAEDAVEQRGLAAAEKAGQQVNGDTRFDLIFHFGLLTRRRAFRIGNNLSRRPGPRFVDRGRRLKAGPGSISLSVIS